jgi:hypothetical protein
MRRSLDLDTDLEAELSHIVALTKKDPLAVLTQAIRVGLPNVASNLNSTRPDGYFADDYGVDAERVALESAMSSVDQFPER